MNSAGDSTSPDWKTIVADWISSGLSQTKFCAQRGLKSHQLSYHYRKYHSAGKSSTKLASIAVATDASMSPATSGFVLVFPRGIKLSVPPQFCQQSLPCLLRILQEVAC